MSSRCISHGPEVEDRRNRMEMRNAIERRWKPRMRKRTKDKKITNLRDSSLESGNLHS
jgi:hypothetical protein